MLLCKHRSLKVFSQPQELAVNITTLPSFHSHFFRSLSLQAREEGTAVHEGKKTDDNNTQGLL